MKDFILKLNDGIPRSEVTQEFQPMINNLIKAKAIDEHKNTYFLNRKFKLGTVDIVTSGIRFLNVAGESGRDLLIETRDLNGAAKSDFVLARQLHSKNRSRIKAKVVLIIERAHNTSIIYTKTQNNRIVGINISTALPCDITASQKSLKLLPEHTVLKIDNATNNIIEVLGSMDDPSVDEKIALGLYEKEEFFSKESEEEALSHGTYVDKTLYPNRVDLTHLPFCTIDPIDAKDFDDAIYFDHENFILYVAIADVSEYVFEMGHIDKEAKKRGFSIYFPHKSIPMLPRALSENICSLKPNVDRLAYTFKITLDRKTLNPIKEELFDGVINSKKRYHYDQIDLILQNQYPNLDAMDHKIRTFLMPLHEVTQKLKNKRLQEGFDFASSEIRMELDTEQNLIATREEVETPSHQLIEDCMLLANKAASKKISYGIFRTHDDPSYDKLQTMLDDLAMIGISVDFSTDIPKMIKEIQDKASLLDIRTEVDKLIIRSQKKAKYEPENRGHFGLGFKSYTHFTSPIRRYSDLILHRLLKATMHHESKRFNYLLQDITTTCEKISELERQSAKVAWDYMDRKFARWAAEHIGETYQAVVTSAERTPIAKLDDEIKGARLFLLDYNVQLFQKIRISITEVDIPSARIFAKVVQTDV
ncbi:ribonuclease R family protein [Sulfurospirillum sp. 1612]|uniref:ribonuclease R family protein n=1 Tax=Sulfurospirillum sp. 1612 TaxID=3094835 RepID=UPI002F938CA1